MTDLIPAGATEKHIAFLGSTGSGKTSAAKRGLVEPALDAGARVLILDPTGAWWGLRLAADGKRKGLPIYIFGGDHGDYPLRARDAALLAETFATSSDSAVFDMSLMTVSERTAFFTEFAETIRRKNKGPLHLVIDEAHLFMPQAGAASGGAVPAMLHAANNLVSLGRSRGLRIALISQRPAKVHKDSLTQVQSLVAMRLLAPQDRKAISDWIADQADPTKGKEIIASLPTLKPGEAWVWSPQDDVLRHTKFPLPRTFDSSRAPTSSDGKGPELAPVNMDALRDRLTALETDRKANDPKALKAEIIRLQAELRTASAIVPPISEDERQRAYQEGFRAGETAVSERWAPKIRAAMASIAGLDTLFMQELPLPAPKTTPRLNDWIQKNPPPDPRQRPAGQPDKAGQSALVLPKGERACLIAAAQHPNGVTRQQLTVLTGYKRSSRDAYIQRLRERGYVETTDRVLNTERIRATDEGLAALGPDFEPLPTGAALREHVLRTLPEGERKVLEVLIGRYPHHVDRNDIDEATGYKRSSRDAYLQRLSARELIHPSAAPRAADTLFD